MPNQQLSGAKLILINTDGTEQPPITDFRKAVHKDNGTFKLVTGTADAPIETDYDIVQQITDSMKPIPIIYGAMFEGITDIATEQANLKAAGLNTIRIPVFWGQNPISKTIDSFLQAGFNVVPNFNYLPTSTPQNFPTDSAAIRSNAETFFSHYAPFKNQIPYVTIGNEWDNNNYYKWANDMKIDAAQVDAYVNQLSICTDVAHKYGFKVVDAGITSNGIREWYYSVLTTDAAKKDWASRYITGKDNPLFSYWCARVNYYALKAINIPFDYSNIHWYNRTTCGNGFKECSTAYATACGKKQLLSNEFGLFTASLDLFRQTVNEMKAANPASMIAYSGKNIANEAVTLPTDYLQLLQ